MGSNAAISGPRSGSAAWLGWAFLPEAKGHEHMIGYLKQWRGKTEPDDKSGEADYMVEGELFSIPLPSFEHAQRLDTLLLVAFKQGKQFAFRAVKDHIAGAVLAADRAHSLTMTT